MTIYIVTRGEYSDYHIEAVFTNREQAKLYCATHNDGWGECQIEEWETDEIKLDSSQELCEKWHGTFDFEGNLTDFYNLGLSLRKPIKWGVRKWGRIEYFVTVCVPEGTDKDKVKKIMCDNFAQHKAELLGVY